MREPRISVLVVARDEAHNLADCLAAARWADERVVVVDSSSRDGTVEIARRLADVVAVRVFDDFASQRNAALALSSGDWVLSVDADERITPALAASHQNARSLCYKLSSPSRARLQGFHGLLRCWCNDLLRRCTNRCSASDPRGRCR